MEAAPGGGSGLLCEATALEPDAVLFGLLDESHPERGGAPAEPHPQNLGFFPPFDGLDDT